ncbi:uncharacterized protein [Cicer arietinum]|uniref:uncharacterized protein isoform X1 n=1 Tax=Cicer arietinum TaxID=3827 RepID=UPI003CC55910
MQHPFKAKGNQEIIILNSWVPFHVRRIRNIQSAQTILLGGFCLHAQLGFVSRYMQTLHSGLLVPTKFAPQDYYVRSAFGGFNLVRVAMIIKILGLVISMDLL